MDDLGFKPTNQIPTAAKRKSKYTAFLNKVKKSKRVYVKTFENNKKASIKAASFRTHIRAHHLDGINVTVRGNQLFVFSDESVKENA